MTTVKATEVEISGAEEHPTPELRFIRRLKPIYRIHYGEEAVVGYDPIKVLQQKWIVRRFSMGSGKPIDIAQSEEWRDVATVDATEDGE